MNTVTTTVLIWGHHFGLKFILVVSYLVKFYDSISLCLKLNCWLKNKNRKWLLHPIKSLYLQREDIAVEPFFVPFDNSIDQSELTKRNIAVHSKHIVRKRYCGEIWHDTWTTWPLTKALQLVESIEIKLLDS